MDHFIDKFAKRENAQEMIKANTMAEAKEREKLAEQLAEYELAIQEMKRCSLQNIENAEKVKELLTASLSQIEEAQKRATESGAAAEKTAGEVKTLLEALKEQMENLLGEQQSGIAALLEKQDERTKELLEKQNEQTKELLAVQTKEMEELIHAAEDFDHKEAVKVYRNVQACIEEALPKQTTEIKEAVGEAVKEKKQTGIFAVCVLTLLATAANVAIEVLKMLGYL